MKRTRIMGLLLIAAFSLSAIGAASASAAGEYEIAGLPELGRCVKVGKGGHFKGRKCLSPSPSGKAKYEWLPGAGKENKFVGVGVEPEPVLETVTGSKIICSAAVFKGEYTGPKTEKENINFSGCLLGTKSCQTNPAKEGEIEVEGIEGHLGFINKHTAKPKTGWDLTHGGTPWASYTCGSITKGEVPTAYQLEGSVIGAIKPVDVMTEEEHIKFLAVKGKQVPEMFESGVKDTLVTTNVVEHTSMQTGLTVTDETESGIGEIKEKPENQEPVEIKALCKGEGC